MDVIDFSNKQEKLVSGENIKRICGNDILGSGDLTASDLNQIFYSDIVYYIVNDIVVYQGYLFMCIKASHSNTPNPNGDTEYWKKITTEAIGLRIVNETSSLVSLTATIGKYYILSQPVDTLDITLPAVSNTGFTQEIMFKFTTGSTPALTFTSADSKTIEYESNYSIDASTKYELHALFNGYSWSIAYGTLT